jgi:hypothetical protein
MQTTTPDRRTTASRIEVGDLDIERIREYARARSGAAIHFERRPGHTYLVAESA